MRSRTAVIYCGHPDIHPSVPSGYSTHLRGVISGLTANGVSTTMCFAGSTTPAPSLATGTVGTPTSRTLVRQVMPGAIWNTLRDARLASFDRRTTRQLGNLLSAHPATLVYERHTHLHHLGARTAQQSGATHILEVNAPPGERANLGGRSPLDGLASSRARRAILNTDVAVFVSSALKFYYQNLCDDALDHSIVVPNGVDKELFGIETETSLSSGPTIRIGFTGSLFEWHGLDLLIRAFARLARDHEQVVLTIVGDGPERRSLESLAASLGVNDRVEFIGSVPHEAAIDWTTRFDIAVMANSNWYGSPTKLTEYAATGRAMIVPATDPVGEVFTHNHDVLVSLPNVLDLERSLRSLILEPDLRKRLGDNARTTARVSLTWDALVLKILLKAEEVKPWPT